MLDKVEAAIGLPHEGLSPNCELTKKEPLLSQVVGMGGSFVSATGMPRPIHSSLLNARYVRQAQHVTHHVLFSYLNSQNS